MNKNNFPGGSRGAVNRAGARVREAQFDFNDARIIDDWRAAHRSVLNTFQAILRTRTKNSEIIVAQRHKRLTTIIDKLRRYNKMQLSRMDDVAGCRLIFKNINDLYEFRKKLHKSRFKHELKNDNDKYDYIKNPKYSGYRGVHDIYSYNVNSIPGEKFKGLLIEIQYRTIYQHTWATTVELVGFITANRPKFDKGDKRYLKILGLSSEIIARAYEDRYSCFEGLSDKQVVKEFATLDNELNFVRMLERLNASNAEYTKSKNMILIFSEDDELETRSYRDATDALKALFELERENTCRDIVLVKADTSEDIRIAFKNYFSDASEFLELINNGCNKLLGEQVLTVKVDL